MSSHSVGCDSVSLRIRTGGMKHLEGKFKGHGNFNLYYQSWLPSNGTKAILLLVHGFAEHSGRYINIVNCFVPKGYAVYGLDHRGHGRSEGRRGYVEQFSYYLKDLKTFFDIVHGKHRDIKIFLIGHSMGGTIAAAYAVHYQHEFDGLILSGANVKVGTGFSPLLIAVARIFSLLLPKMGIVALDASAISQDKVVVDAYVNDPLVYRGKIPSRLGSELVRVMQKLPHQMSKVNLPILIMHGTADRLSDPKGSEMLYERVSSRDKTLKLYGGFYHEIFNEPGRERVFTDMETWLTARI
jgi:alpha-beta hydrolase superfamily lysophospholipase